MLKWRVACCSLLSSRLIPNCHGWKTNTMCESEEFHRNNVEMLVSTSQYSLGVRNYSITSKTDSDSLPTELAANTPQSSAFLMSSGTAGLFSVGGLISFFPLYFYNNIGVANQLYYYSVSPLWIFIFKLKSLLTHY